MHTKREEIIENMERRKEQLQRMLEESKDKLTRHLAGENVFDDDEVREHGMGPTSITDAFTHSSLTISTSISMHLYELPYYLYQMCIRACVPHPWSNRHMRRSRGVWKLLKRNWSVWMSWMNM
jgi:hypothetical protein